LFVSNIKTQNSWSLGRDLNSNLPIQSRNTKHATAIRRVSDVWFSEKCPLSNFVHFIGPKEQPCPRGLFESWTSKQGQSEWM